MSAKNTFDTWKQALISAPILGYPDASVEYILGTEASLVGIDAVLSQVQKDQERVVSYYSKTSQPTEKTTVGPTESYLLW